MKRIQKLCVGGKDEKSEFCVVGAYLNRNASSFVPCASLDFFDASLFFCCLRTPFWRCLYQEQATTTMDLKGFLSINFSDIFLDYIHETALIRNTFEKHDFMCFCSNRHFM